MNRNNNRALAFIFITILLDIVGIGIIIPVAPKLISQLTHENLSNASMYSGWLMFTFSIMQFIFSPFMGCLSDRYGRRPVLLVSLFGFGINYLTTAFAPSIGWLFAGRALAGITGASITTASAYIADISTAEKRAQNFGLIGAAFGLGFIIGPVLGGILGHISVRLPFYVAASLSFLNWLYGLLFLPESLDKMNRRNFEWNRSNPLGTITLLRRYPVVSGLIISLFCINVAGFATQSTWTFYTMEAFHWNEAMVGYSLGLAGLLMALVQGGLVRIVNPRLGEIRSIYTGLLFYTIGFVLIAIVTKTWMLFALMIVYSLGGIAGPAVQGLISNSVPDNEQGELQGALTSLMSLASIAGPLLMTSLFSHFSSHQTGIYLPSAPFIMAALLVVASSLFAKKTFTSLHRMKASDENIK